MAEAAVISADLDRVRTLTGRVEELAYGACGADRAYNVVHSLTWHAPVSTLDLAERLTQRITGPEWRAKGLSDLAQAAAFSGDLDRALANLEQAEALVTVGHAEESDISLVNVRQRVEALAEVAEAFARCGDPERAVTVVHQSQVVLDEHEEARAAPAMLLAWTGDLDGAEARTHALSAYSETRVRAVIAQQMARAGDVDGAEQLAGTFTPYWEAETVAALAEIVDLDRARTLLARLLCQDEWRRALHALARVEPAALTPAARPAQAAQGES